MIEQFQKLHGSPLKQKPPCTYIENHCTLSQKTNDHSQSINAHSLWHTPKLSYLPTKQHLSPAQFETLMLFPLTT